tara:strand:+ start:301 stop:708 length:408 start_codon:yes stop_codon:yes gene_type:complete
MKNIVNITKPAWNKIGQVLNKTNKCSFLFSATGGGCNGYNYNFKVIEEDKFNSIINQTKIKPTLIENNGNKVLIDPLSEFLLTGTTIDFEETIYESKFNFITNKDTAYSCGCGTSFTLKKPKISDTNKIPGNFIW